MGRAQGVHAHLLEESHLPDQGVRIVDGPQRALVVVEIDSLELHRHPVEVEPGVRVEPQPADAEKSAVRVDRNAVADEVGLQRVEVWIRGGPQMRLGNPDVEGGLTGLRAELHGTRRRLRDGRPRSVEDPGCYPDDRVRAAVVDDVHGGVHRGVAEFVLGCHRRRGHEDSVAGDVDRVRDGEPDVARDAATRIPATVGLQVLNHDGENVGSYAVSVDDLADIQAEARIAVGVIADALAVQVQPRVHVDPVEVQADRLARHRRGQGERLPVPAQTAREVARRVADPGRLRQQLDTPVVRESDRLPRRVVEADRRGERVRGVAERPRWIGRVPGIDQDELPAGVEVDAARAAVRDCVGGRRACHRLGGRPQRELSDDKSQDGTSRQHDGSEPPGTHSAHVCLTHSNNRHVDRGDP